LDGVGLGAAEGGRLSFREKSGMKFLLRSGELYVDDGLARKDDRLPASLSVWDFLGGRGRAFAVFFSSAVDLRSNASALLRDSARRFFGMARSVSESTLVERFSKATSSMTSRILDE